MNVSLAELSGVDLALVLGKLRSTRPFCWVEVLGGWLVTSHELAIAVMRDSATFTVDDPRFSTAQVVGSSMLSLDGDAHQRHRASFGPAFRPAEVEQRFGAHVDELATELVERIVATGQADLRAAVAGPLSVAVVTDALGLRTADAPAVLRWYSAIVDAVSAITAGLSPDPAAAEAMRDLAHAIDDHHVDSLLAGAYAELSRDEVVSNAAVLMFGGIETTEAMISNALVHLLSNPDELSAVRADPAMIPSVVEESLRLEPAAAMVDRFATSAVELDGCAIAAGDLIRVSLAGANRDPAVFADPDVFDPRRLNVRSQLAFARGQHVCIATDLARLETVTALRVLLERLPNLTLAEPVAAIGLVFRKPPRVPVWWRP